MAEHSSGSVWYLFGVASFMLETSPSNLLLTVSKSSPLNGTFSRLRDDLKTSHSGTIHESYWKFNVFVQ
jgi:hypothetical protein